MVNICFFPELGESTNGMVCLVVISFFWGTLLAIPNMAGNKTSQKIKGIIIIENEWFPSQQGYINYQAALCSHHLQEASRCGGKW